MSALITAILHQWMGLPRIRDQDLLDDTDVPDSGTSSVSIQTEQDKRVDTAVALGILREELCLLQRSHAVLHEEYVQLKEVVLEDHRVSDNKEEVFKLDIFEERSSPTHLTEKLRKVSGEKALLEQELAILNGLIEKRLAETGKVTNEVTQLNWSFEELQDKIKETKKATELVKDNFDLEAATKKDMAAKLVRSEEQLHIALDQIDRMKLDKTSFINELQTVKKHLNVTSDDLARLRREKERWLDDGSLAGAYKSDIEFEELENEIEELEGELEDSNLKLTAVQTELGALKEEVVKVRQSRDSLRIETRRKDALIAKLRSDLKGVTCVLHSSQEELSSLREDKKSWTENQQKSFGAMSNDLVKTLNSAREDVRKLVNEERKWQQEPMAAESAFGDVIVTVNTQDDNSEVFKAIVEALGKIHQKYMQNIEATSPEPETTDSYHSVEEQLSEGTISAESVSSPSLSEGEYEPNKPLDPIVAAGVVSKVC